MFVKMAYSGIGIARKGYFFRFYEVRRAQNGVRLRSRKPIQNVGTFSRPLLYVLFIRSVM